MNGQLIEQLSFSLFGVLCTLVIAIPFLSIFWGTQEPGVGQHTGYVTATEQGGFFWKTDRAFFKTDATSSQEDAYCVANDFILEKLRIAQQTKSLVTIIYRGELVVPKSSCRDENATIIDVIE